MSLEKKASKMLPMCHFQYLDMVFETCLKYELQAHQFSWSVCFSKKFTRVEDTHQILFFVTVKLITWLFYTFAYKNCNQ